MALIQSAKTIRPIYQPLTVSCSVVCTSATSPTVQEMLAGKYNPDRIATPCELLPVVNCLVSDGSLATGNGNQWITSVAWLLNGADIATQLTSGTDYTIDTNPGATCGRLTFYVNVSPGTVWTLQFKATLIDPRGNGQQYSILSDQIEMTTVKTADDRIRIVTDTEPAIAYDPLLDHQLLDDFCAANGYAADRPSAAELSAYRPFSYNRRFPLRVMQGDTQLTPGTDYDIRIYAVTASATTRLDGAAEPNELTALDYDTTAKTVTIGIDLRLSLVRGFRIEAVSVGSSPRVLAVTHVGMTRRPVAMRIVSQNGAALMPGHYDRADAVLAHDMRGNIIKHPELYQEIGFYGDATGAISEATISSGRTTLLGTGRQVQYKLAKLGVNVDQRSAVLHTAITAEERGTFSFLVDENGDYLVDEDDNYLISN